MSVIAAIIVFTGMKFVVPTILKGPLFIGLAKLSSSFAWLIACIFLLPGAISMFNAWRKENFSKPDRFDITFKTLMEGI